MFGSQVKRLAATIVDAPPRVPATASEPPTTRERLLGLLAREGVRVPLAVFVLSRLYVFLLGAIAMQINVMLAPVAALGYFMPPLYGLEHYLLQPWRNWDGHWYALIALEGYGVDRSVTAFYPLYPLLLHWGAWLLDGRLVLAGVLISNVCFLAALFLLYRLLAEDFSAAVARRALVLLALFPTAYYFTAVYSESLFLLVAVGAFYAARHNWWWLAGLCGFLATLTRVHGILLLLPLGILFLKQQGWNPRRWRANPMSLTLVPAGLLVYMAYLRRVWDDPLVMLKAQKGWDRYQATPLQTLIDGVKQVDGCAVHDWPTANVNYCWAQQFVQHPSLATVRDLGWRWGISESNVTELAFTILLIALGIAAFRLLPLAYSSYLAAGIILPLWSPSKVHALMSMGRFALILFPAFIVLALVARWRPVYAALVVLSALLLAFFAIQFASWFWVA